MKPKNYGNIFLMISPAVASANSLFKSMITGNENTITIGDETMGAYYGHNGHSSLEYKSPNSKLITTFSIVNLEHKMYPKKIIKNLEGVYYPII